MSELTPVWSVIVQLVNPSSSPLPVTSSSSSLTAASSSQPQQQQQHSEPSTSSSCQPQLAPKSQHSTKHRTKSQSSLNTQVLLPASKCSSHFTVITAVIGPSAYSALEVLYIMRYINLLTYLLYLLT